MATMRTGDIHTPLHVAPSRGGDAFLLSGVTPTLSLTMTDPTGAVVDTSAVTLDMDGDTIALHLPTTTSLFTKSGLYVLNLTVEETDEGGSLTPGEDLLPSDGLLLEGEPSFSRLHADPVLLVVEASDGWHDLASARREWKDAPRDDVQLYSLLRLAAQQVSEFAGTDLDTVPLNHRVAQLVQARNTWNASKVSPGGDMGTEGFVIRPFPLDWTVRQIIRPKRGMPTVA